MKNKGVEKNITDQIFRKLGEVVSELIVMQHELQKGEDIRCSLISLERRLTMWLSCLSRSSTVDSPEPSEDLVSQLLNIAEKIVSGIDKDHLQNLSLSFVEDDSESVKGYRVKVDISAIKDMDKDKSGGKKRFLF